MKILKFTPGLLIATFILFGSNKNLFAHCEIPCGIYGDTMRIELISEHITTIEKSMVMINELSSANDVDYHMITRWTINKEEHANKIQDIVSQYFLHQRIKPKTEDNAKAYEKYITELKLLHQLLIYAMKAKQTTDIELINKLTETLKLFSQSYFEEHHH